MELTHFKITGGPIAAKWLEFKAYKIACMDAINAFVKEIGAKNIWGGRSVSYVEFEGAAPPGWVKHKKKNGHIPGKKLPEVAKRMSELTIPEGKTLWKMLSGQSNHMIFTYRRLYESAAGYEEIDDHTGILSVTKKPTSKDLEDDGGDMEDDDEAWWMPEETEHCVKLKLSEYHALLESKEEKGKAS